jgi:hypothetical protein
MSQSATYVPTPVSDSTMLSIPEQYAEEVMKRVDENQRDQRLRQSILDALGASAWESALTTFGHRWRGQDTLTWGDPIKWIRIKWHLQCLAEVISERPDECLIIYNVLQDITTSAYLAEVKQMYDLKDTHPGLIEVLMEAWPYLSKHFGPHPMVSLEVVHDPTSPDVDQLFAYIHTSLAADEALDKLDELDEEWFLSRADKVGALFNFNLATP